MGKHKKSEKVVTDELCKYGCGNIAKYISPGGKYICEDSHSKCPSNKKKNSEAIKVYMSMVY